MTSSKYDGKKRLKIFGTIAAASTLGLYPANLVAAGEVLTYQYNAQGRLVGVNRSDGTQVAYTYDFAGNRVSVNVNGAPANNSPVVANWSFESPMLGHTNFVYQPTAAGSTFVHGSGITANNSAWGFSAAPNGSQVAFLQTSHGEISLAVSNLTIGQSYRVTGTAMRRPNYPLSPFTVRVNGTTLATISPADSFTAFTTGSFTATATTATLSFTATPGLDAASGIDAIAVVPQ